MTDLHQGSVFRGSSAAPALGNQVLVVSNDTATRERVRGQLAELRWAVQEASGGAEALIRLESMSPNAVLIESWLPDLEAGEFVQQLRSQYPSVDMLWMDGTPCAGAPRSPRRHELLRVLHAMADTGQNAMHAWEASPRTIPARPDVMNQAPPLDVVERVGGSASAPAFSSAVNVVRGDDTASFASIAGSGLESRTEPSLVLPGMVGASQPMLELARLIRLVAPRNAAVLVEGETGTGKELVAKAVHKLSERAGKPFMILNCAAIPEQLLEAELFGHTRGAFTGAVTSRTGRIEAAHGGTLFLDEIGEMPIGLQAKMLRFLESGEIQRVGDNDVSRVDVRIVSATHQPLVERSNAGTFRADLYHRLAVFPVHLPALRERMEDLPMLVSYLLDRLGERMPKRSMTADGMQKLANYMWPGNVRELTHVLERACILSGDRPRLLPEDLRMRSSVRQPV